MYPSSLRRGQSPRCSHPACGSTANLSEVITDEGIERPFTHYQGRLRGELRGVLRVAQLALADACDSGAAAINGRLIDAARAAWEPSS